MPLNDTKVRALFGKAQKGEKVGKEADGGGLNLIEGKYWRLSYRFAGKQKTLALGVYPTVSLAAARKGRDEAKVLLSQGIDPSAKKKADKAEADRVAQEEVLTFRVVAMEYFQRKLTDKRELYKKQVLSRLENQIFPFMGDISVSQLKPTHILAGLRVVEARGSIDMAHRLASLIRQICSYAVACGYTEFNAASELTAAMTPKPKATPRAAILAPEKIGQLLRDIEEYPGSISIRYALKLMPYLFVRSKELRNAKWDEFDFENALWHIPAERMKMKSAHVVPLSQQVIRLLKELQVWNGHIDLLFPSPQSNTKAITDVALLNALRRMGYEREEMCIHGFRSIASTLLNEAGKYRSDVIEAALAHVDKNQVRAAYNRAEYIEERRVLMQDWADMVDAMRAGKA
jgi:integrase